MAKRTVLSTAIDARVKKAATEYCNARGLKLQYFIERALQEQMEDILDLETYQKRKNEETIPLEEILNPRKT